MKVVENGIDRYLERLQTKMIIRCKNMNTSTPGTLLFHA